MYFPTIVIDLVVIAVMLIDNFILTGGQRTVVQAWGVSSSNARADAQTEAPLEALVCYSSSKTAGITPSQPPHVPIQHMSHGQNSFYKAL